MSTTDHTAPAPVLLLHGAWHGAWCWERVARDLRAGGHVVAAIDLPGACAPSGGSAAVPLGTLSAADYADVARDALVELTGRHGPAVVVAHSLAGVVAHHLGERATAHVAHLVYLAALAPAPGGTVFGGIASTAFAGSDLTSLPFGDPATTGVLRVDWHAPGTDLLPAARRCFFGETPATEAAAAAARLAPDVPVRVYSDEVRLRAGAWGTLPRTWIRCTRDRAVPVAAQDESIAALDGAFPEHPFRVHSLETDHSPFLSRPGELARVIGSVAAGNG